MPYEINYSGTDKIILQRRSVMGAMILIIMIGSIFTIVGIGVIYLLKNTEPPFSYMRFLFLIFGILAIVGGINYPKFTKARIPEMIIFDNQKGYIEIEQNSKVSQKGYISYQDIANFDIHEEYHSGSGSSNKYSNSSNRGYYTYHVLLRKRDRGEWYLREWRSRNDAEKMVAEFKALKLTAPATNIPKSELSNKLNKESMGEKTILSWRNKLGASPFIFTVVVLFVGAFLYMIATLLITKGGDILVVPVYLILGFISLIFLGIVFLQTRKMIKNATTTYSISVSRNTIEYAESDNSGNVRSSKIIPLKDAYSIVFSHKSSEKNAPLYIFTKNEADKYAQVKSNPVNIESIKNIFGMVKDTISLNIEGLNAVECLQVENWLQELILAKSETKVI
jgi:hypothetical protein